MANEAGVWMRGSGVCGCLGHAYEDLYARRDLRAVEDVDK